MGPPSRPARQASDLTVSEDALKGITKSTLNAQLHGIYNWCWQEESGARRKKIQPQVALEPRLTIGGEVERLIFLELARRLLSDSTVESLSHPDQLAMGEVVRRFG